MSISEETQEIINFLFNTNPDMMEKLYKCDSETIREIGSLSQKGINPNDVIAAYESGTSSAINSLYQQAKRLIVLQELYKDLCFEYYKKTKEASKSVECSISQGRSI